MGKRRLGECKERKVKNRRTKWRMEGERGEWELEVEEGRGKRRLGG
jgi:hypothetical protein